MNHHSQTLLRHETLKAMKEVAKLVVLKSKKDFKENPTDAKRFQLQNALGRLHRVSKKVWCHEFKLKV